jgi:hypothetical protein
MEETDRLVVEHLDGEVLVYDTERSEAHVLSGESATLFASAPDEASRREVLRRLALTAAAAAGAALLRTIVVPTPARAQSATCGPTADPCAVSSDCCSGCCCVLGTTPSAPGECVPDATSCLASFGHCR